MKQNSETSLIDVPYSENSDNDYQPLAIQVKTVTKNDADDLERQANYADRMDKHVYKKHGLKLMIGCGIAYIVMVIFDTIVINLGCQASSLTNGLIELLKFVISTLIGFVFSENVKKDKN